ncbi:MAG: hypothetical protein AAF755_05320 [Pseudomonadota bacterium]
MRSTKASGLDLAQPKPRWSEGVDRRGLTVPVGRVEERGRFYQV